MDHPHPIIGDLFDFEIVELSYRRDFNDKLTGTLDIVLSDGATVRRLRFLGVQGLTIRDGFPQSGGITVMDITKRGLEGLNVFVGDVECGRGDVRFWAREVIDLQESV